MQSLHHMKPSSVAHAAGPAAGLTITARLRLETHAEHEAIEKNPWLNRLMAEDLSRTEYAEVLLRFLGFYRHVESGLGAWAAQFPAQLDIAARLGKTELLLKDLKILLAEFQVASYDSPASFATFTSIEQAWGYLYLVEGSTLGGQLIARNLKASIGVTADNGASFYSPYGSLTSEHWQTFKAVLTQEAACGALDESAIVSAAAAAFKALDRWFKTDP